MTDGAAARKERAKARAGRMILHKARLGDAEVDFSPTRGEEALSLATRLSSEAHSLAGITELNVARSALPIRFVARGLP